MPDSFDGIRLKLSRARDQIQGLSAEFSPYLDGLPYRPVVHFDRQSRILTLSVKAHQPPDPMWGVKIGEVAHNLRSALDHIVWELVILTTGRPPVLPTKNQFPIFKSKEGFRDRGVPDQLRCVGQSAVDVIESEQPFSTGENKLSPLWHLQEISNSDKHRTLHLTGTLLDEFSFQFPPLAEPVVRTRLEVGAAGPIQDGSVLWREHISGVLDWPFSKGDVNGHLTTGIAFEQATPAVGGWLVLATLVNISTRVERITSRLATEIFGLTL